MRLCLSVLAVVGGLGLAGCPNDNTGYNGGYGFYPIGGGPSTGCHSDGDCGGGLVCARDGECVGSDQVRRISTSWTVNGAAASDTTCARTPSLEIQFTSAGTGYQIGFAPVPCNEGKFTVDKMPSFYDTVGLGDENGNALQYATFDGSGDASIDLP